MWLVGAGVALAQAPSVIRGRVTTEDGAPVPGAIVTILGADTSSRSTLTDENGQYTQTVPLGTYQVQVFVEGTEAAEKTATVELGKQAIVDFVLAEPQSEVITIVGSRTPRSQLATPVPVDLITSEVLSESTHTETNQILHTVAPSFNATHLSIVDGTDHIDPASLRGLGPEHVLVLVNGRRLHQTSLVNIYNGGTVGVDLNAIPTAAIARIEVLRDGAASQYGSDAIAGVINIVLKDTTDLAEVTATTGITGEGDGAQLKTAANYGVKLGEKGYLNLSAELLERGATSRSGEYTGPVYSSNRELDDQTLAERGLTRDDFKMKIGDSAATVAATSFNLETPLSPNSTFYAFGGLTYRNGRAAGFYRFPFQASQVVPELYPDGFLPEIHTSIDDTSLGAGLRSRKAGWDLDFSVVHGRNTFQFNIENTNNASLGTRSPTTFDAGTLGFAQTVANLDLVRKLDAPFARSLAFVTGSELRLENYWIGAGEEASYSLGPVTTGTPPVPKAPGAQVFPGFQPSNEVDRLRDSIGVYAGFESELTKRISLDLGGRFERYSDFGTSVIGKAAGRVEVAKGVALRGAVSNGFRAPSLHQFWFNNVSTVFVPTGPSGALEAAQILTAHNENPVTKAFGIPDLKEERSLNFSAGLALRPLENLTLTVDGYYITIDDRIVLTSRFTSANPAVRAILAPFPSVSQVQFFANAVDTSTKGLDVVVGYDVDVGPGALALSASANFTRTNVEDVHIPASLSAAFADDQQTLKTNFFGRQEENRLEDVVPRVRGSLTARYNVAKLSALVRASYYGSVRHKPDLSINDESFGGKTLFDVDLGYQVTKNLHLSLGAENLLNTFPDEQTKDANISLGRFVYSRNTSQFGLNGGFYYGKLVLSFF